MRWGILAVLMIGLPGWVIAQEQATPREAQTAVAPPAFDVQIDAPETIRDLLETYLEIKRYRELTDLSDNELKRLMQVAQEDSRTLIATAGYFSPQIQVALDINPIDRHRTVKVSVVPGEPTVVAKVDLNFTGAIVQDPASQLQREKIQNDWSLRDGMRFTQDRWDAAKMLALRQLTSERFPAGQLETTLADIDPPANSAHLKVTLDSGPSYRLGELRIEGLERYDAELVTRLARLPAGSAYSQVELIAAQQRLASSGYFDSVYLSLDTTGEPDKAPVVVKLREGKLQKVVVGVGISTDSGPRLSLEHTHRKLPGLDWRALSKISLDKETRTLSTELTAPPDMDNWRWITSAQLQRQTTDGMNVNSQRLRGGRRHDSDRLDRSYYLEYDRANTPSSTDVLPIVAQSVSVNYAITLRNFDSMPFPSSGWGVGVEVGGGTTLGNEPTPFTRLLARGRYYLPLASSADGPSARLRSGRILLRAESGAVIAKEGIALPSTLLFMTGGDTTVRGYSYRELGVQQTSGLTAPGRYMVNGSVEWQNPILSKGQVTDWETALFVDAGTVADKASALKLKVGVGAGVRWKSPIGPLQFDVAYGVDTKRFRLHMNVGFNF